MSLSRLEGLEGHGQSDHRVLAASESSVDDDQILDLPVLKAASSPMCCATQHKRHRTTAVQEDSGEGCAWSSPERLGNSAILNGLPSIWKVSPDDEGDFLFPQLLHGNLQAQSFKTAINRLECC